MTGVCPQCQTGGIPVKQDGTLVEHNFCNQTNAPRCSGSGMLRDDFTENKTDGYYVGQTVQMMYRAASGWQL